MKAANLRIKSGRLPNRVEWILSINELTNICVQLLMTTKKNQGCGCSSIPFSLILVILGGGYWWLIYQGNFTKISKFFPNLPLANLPLIGQAKPVTPAIPARTNSILPSTPTSKMAIEDRKVSAPISKPTTAPVEPQTLTPPLKSPVSIISKPAPPKTDWDKKVIRGIYISRYQITNDADEQTIRQRVRSYRAQGINTIIHGVWGNGCTMYSSEVMQQMVGAKSCPNLFADRWLDWTIDEAHQQGMQVHAYFEKGIKIDKNSPIFDLAISKKWIVPGVDRTYAKIEHYVLDVEVPEVANLFKKMLAEFVIKYPQIDAVQWDDYLGYYAELPGKVDRTASLTKFVQQMIAGMKAANPNVSFDLCHHNPYWAKRYFAADWENWHVDRAFIQNYSEKNFNEELNYVVNYAGIAIADNQFHRLKELVANPKVKGILIFPLAGKPEETAGKLQKVLQANSSSNLATTKQQKDSLELDKTAPAR
jgi:Glycosyl hydrolase-like 10